MRILDIVPGTSVDGPGLRTSIYVAGCAHACPGCHNPDSWNFDAGRELSQAQILQIVEENGFNVTLTGGDPLYHIAEITPLVAKLRELGYTIWLYTGFTFEEAFKLPGAETLFPMLDAIVDGPFIEAQRDISLHFRGSANQRIIDVKTTLECGEIALMKL